MGFLAGSGGGFIEVVQSTNDAAPVVLRTALMSGVDVVRLLKRSDVVMLWKEGCKALL